MTSPAQPIASRGTPLALQLWAILRDRADCDRRLVFDALARRLGVGELTAKQEQAVTALRTWRKRTGQHGWPSRRTYDAFRAGLDREERRQWPSSTLIRNAFGSWPAAVAAAQGGAPVADVSTRRLTATGSQFQRNELIALVIEWGDGRDRPLYERRFLAWCAKLDEEDPQRHAPHTRTPIRRLFGDWPGLLNTAGLLAAPRPTEGDVDFRDAPQTTGTRYSTSDLVAWLQWVARDRDDRGRFMSDAYYDKRVKELRAAATRQGLGLAIPWSPVFKNHFGSFPNARVAAGLVSADELADRRIVRRGPRPAHQYIGLVVQAAGELRQLPSVEEMQRWLGLRGAGQPTIEEICVAIAGTHGTWDDVLDETLARRPQLRCRYDRAGAPS